ncbi:phospholipase A and acyltransferase 3-like [Tachypleus tridentatus]|uniref:phospholipase A and acyltransferase 3-like n=2 Tax=Tachypleus tridentatus TaxID=6853 RepID=UPI003FD33A89
MNKNQRNKVPPKHKNRVLPPRKAKKLCVKLESFGLTAFYPAVELKAEPGDIVEIDRTLYAHWAIYVGEGNVIHVCGLNNEDIATDTAVVTLAKLSDVAGLSGVRINNKDVPAKERNLKALPPKQVIANAFACLNKSVEYNLLTRSCEHYVTEWKYGEGWSDQASVAVSVMRTLTNDYEAGHSQLVNSLNTVLNCPVSPSPKSTPTTQTSAPDFTR